MQVYVYEHAMIVSYDNKSGTTKFVIKDGKPIHRKYSKEEEFHIEVNKYILNPPEWVFLQPLSFVCYNDEVHLIYRFVVEPDTKLRNGAVWHDNVYLEDKLSVVIAKIGMQNV